MADGRDVRLHCTSGDRSHLATRVLLCEGFDARSLSGDSGTQPPTSQVYDLAGGIGAWQSMGGPMVMGGR